MKLEKDLGGYRMKLNDVTDLMDETYVLTFDNDVSHMKVTSVSFEKVMNELKKRIDDTSMYVNPGRESEYSIKLDFGDIEYTILESHSGSEETTFTEYGMNLLLNYYDDDDEE
jgi:hypothetical protein